MASSTEPFPPPPQFAKTLTSPSPIAKSALRVPGPHGMPLSMCVHSLIWMLNFDVVDTDAHFDTRSLVDTHPLIDTHAHPSIHPRVDLHARLSICIRDRAGLLAKWMLVAERVTREQTGNWSALFRNREDRVYGLARTAVVVGRAQSSWPSRHPDGGLLMRVAGSVRAGRPNVAGTSRGSCDERSGLGAKPYTLA